MTTGLSKSRLMSYQQCDRKLWLSVHGPELAAVSDSNQARFDQGNEVGEFARREAEKSFGAATLIDVRPHGWKEGVRLCEEALARAGVQVLFEAPFIGGGIGVLVDIVVRAADGALTLVEVKSSTSLKGKPYVDDAAVQAWTMTAAGHAPDRVVLRLLDSSWVYQGDGDYGGLFKDINVTTEVQARFEKMPELVRKAQLTLEGMEPQTEPGKHCSKPFACGFGAHCQAWDAARKRPLPRNPVGMLLRRNMGTFTRAEKKALKGGTYADLSDLPETFPEDERTRAIVRSLREGKAWASGDLVKLLAAVPYPRYHFDFETIAFAVPRWKATRPYQQVPFQWSCHVEHGDRTVEHHEYLDISGDDPREECARKIVELMGKTGDGVVVVYSQSFEETRLKELARDFPEHAAGLKRVIARLVDLLPVFREHYFHPDLDASWSIKKVLPTVASELDYANLTEVQDGGGAQRAYLEAIASIDLRRKAEVSERMLMYCGRDTEAMLRLIRVAEKPLSQLDVGRRVQLLRVRWL